MRPLNRRGTLSLQITADDILSLAVNVAQNGWSQDECRPDTGDVPITLPPAVLHDIYAALVAGASGRSQADASETETRRGGRGPIGVKHWPDLFFILGGACCWSFCLSMPVQLLLIVVTRQ